MSENLTVATLVMSVVVFLIARRFMQRFAAAKVDATCDTDSLALGPALDAMYGLTASARASTAGAISLKKCFGLNNPFVSPSEDMQRAYRQGLVKAFKKVDGAAWAAVAVSVAESIKPLLYREQNGDGKLTLRVNVRDISRQATVVAILKSLFGIDAVSREMAAYIGSEIPRLMIWKKQIDANSSSPGLIPQEFADASGRLRGVLCELFGEAKDANELARGLLCEVSGTVDDFNPLDLIMPAFEAPWRVIFYGLLAVLKQGRGGCDDVKSLRDCRSDARPPGRVAAIACETLRLYPPTRRMRLGRKSDGNKASDKRRIADMDQKVDLEAILRDAEHWGSSAKEWRPSRFLKDSGSIDNSLTSHASGFVPFAAGPIKCPAAAEFGPRLTTVVMGEVLRQLFPAGGHPRWCVKGPEWDSPSTVGDLLRLGRDEYACVDVIAWEEWQQQDAAGLSRPRTR